VINTRVKICSLLAASRQIDMSRRCLTGRYQPAAAAQQDSHAKPTSLVESVKNCCPPVVSSWFESFNDKELAQQGKAKRTLKSSASLLPSRTESAAARKPDAIRTTTTPDISQRMVEALAAAQHKDRKQPAKEEQNHSFAFEEETFTASDVLTPDEPLPWQEMQQDKHIDEESHDSTDANNDPEHVD
jgi:hypothetical protein